MNASKSILIALLLLFAVMVGCQTPAGSPPPEPLSGWLYRTQGLVGVFPPREDVYVGDVHLYLSDPDGGGHTELYAAPRWTHLAARELLRSSDRIRPAYPPTPRDYLNADLRVDDRAWPESTGEIEPLESDTTKERLRSIQLPPMVHHRSRSGELPPSWGIHELLEESYEDWKLIRLRIETAERAGLELAAAVDSFLDSRDSTFYLPAELKQNILALAPPHVKNVWVRIVTEVIYMRAMRVTIVPEDSFDPLDDDVSAAELGDDDVDPEIARDDLDPSYASIARANAMNRELIESGTDALPDSFIRFLSVSEHSTTARRVFRRPMAIGVGGLSLRVNAGTGEVEAIRLIGRNLSPPRPTNRVASEEGVVGAEADLDPAADDGSSAEAMPSEEPQGAEPPIDP